MSNITSFTKIRSLALFIVISSALIFSPFAFAQEAQETQGEPEENITDSTLEEVSENTVDERPIVIVGKPLISNSTEGTFTLQFLIRNETDVEKSFYYGVEVTTHELLGGQLLDAQGGGMHTLSANEEETLSIVYNRPTWFQEEIELHVAVYAEDGSFLDRGLVQRILMSGQKPDIELFADSCVLNRGEDIKVLTSFTPTTPNEDLDFSCVVVNNTDSEQTIVPVVSLYAPIHNPEALTVKKGSPTPVPPKETAIVHFETQAPSQGVFYTAHFSVEPNDVSSNSAVSNNLRNDEVVTQENQTDVNAQQETNIVFVVVITLLALMTLLAILVYQRKMKEPLEAMHNPEN